jgi:hypothetical protein
MLYDGGSRWYCPTCCFHPLSNGFTDRRMGQDPKIQFAISDQRKILHRFLLSDFLFRYTFGTGPYYLIRLTELPSNTGRIYTRLSFSKTCINRWYSRNSKFPVPLINLTKGLYDQQKSFSAIVFLYCLS